MVVGLQEAHLALFGSASAVGVGHVLCQTLVLGHGTAALNLLTLSVGLSLGRLFAQQACEFTCAPCVELALGVETVCVVDVGDQVVGDFFCEGQRALSPVHLLSASSRRIVSPARSLLSSLRCSRSSSSRFSASSASLAARSAVTVVRAFLSTLVGVPIGDKRARESGCQTPYKLTCRQRLDGRRA